MPKEEAGGGVFFSASLSSKRQKKTPPPWGFSRETPVSVNLLLSENEACYDYDQQYFRGLKLLSGNSEQIFLRGG